MPVLHSGDGERKMADLRIMLDNMLTEKINKVTGSEVMLFRSFC